MKALVIICFICRLRGQVFDLTSNCPYPPFHRKKLTTREVRDAVDKNELWFYIPPWQVPKVEYTCIQCRRFVIQNTPMKKIICMAKKNMTINGPVGKNLHLSFLFIFIFFLPIHILIQIPE